MCVVSMVLDHYRDDWFKRYPQIEPIKPFEPLNPPKKDEPIDFSKFFKQEITREEFENLKKEVEQLKLLLKRAKEYDEKNNEPNCEMDEKVALVKKIAEFVGVDLDEIFKNK